MEIGVLGTSATCPSAVPTQKKLDRLTGTLGVDVIDELGAVPGPLLHADALRTTYGRALRYNLDPTKYMRPQDCDVPDPSTAPDPPEIRK